MLPFLRAPPILFRRRWRRVPPNLRGITLVLIDSVVISVMVLVIKLLGSAYHANELAFFRSAMGLALLAPLMIARGAAAFRTRRLPMHVLRVLFGAGSLICSYYAVVELTLADATSIGFTRPMIMMIFAVLFLGEIVGWRRWSAVAVGFVGVLVMMRPGGSAFDPAMLVALFGAVLACATVVVVKKLTETETTMSLMTYSAILMTVLTAIPAIPVWRTPMIEHWPLILAIGLLGTLGQFCFLRAYEDGQASVLAPFEYTRLLFAIAIGYGVFDEWPDKWTLIGAAIVAGSTLYIVHREARLKRQAATIPPNEPPPVGGR